jgi:meso-butanediol dehydrogenase/(S,S)-butanediol dehydrogenase/diacetyl reductase
MRLSGRTAIVSGGARGIGAATATRLREEGADIAIVDVLREDGARTAREVGERFFEADAKSGVIGLTRSAALDLGPSGVRVNAVCPGIVETAMWQAWMEQLDDPAAVTRQVLQMQPLGRIGRAQDVAAAVAFLASDDAAYVTGTSLYVDGGNTARLHDVFGE